MRLRTKPRPERPRAPLPLDGEPQLPVWAFNDKVHVVGDRTVVGLRDRQRLSIFRPTSAAWAVVKERMGMRSNAAVRAAGHRRRSGSFDPGGDHGDEAEPTCRGIPDPADDRERHESPGQGDRRDPPNEHAKRCSPQGGGAHASERSGSGSDLGTAMSDQYRSAWPRRRWCSPARDRSPAGTRAPCP